MAIVDSLLFRSLDPHVGGHLTPDEIVRRVAARFPLAIIDHERGNRMVRAAADEMVELGLPTTDTLVANHRALEGRVAYVTIREREGGPTFGFLLLPHPSVFDIDYERPEERDACRPLLEALAGELAEYDLKTEDVDDRMASSTNWLVVPTERVDALIELFDGNIHNLRDEAGHYASFSDGNVEGSDLNNLWSILQEPPHGDRLICNEVFRDGGEGHPKLGRVSADCVRVLAELDEANVPAVAAAWQRTGIMVDGSVDAAAAVIRELQVLSRQAASDGHAVLLLWWN